MILRFARGWTMSSATSIKGDQRSFGQDGRAVGQARAADEGFRPWHFFVLASLVASTIAVIISRRAAPEHLILISLTIGAAGLRLQPSIARSCRWFFAMLDADPASIRAGASGGGARKNTRASFDQGTRIRPRDGKGLGEGLR